MFIQTRNSNGQLFYFNLENLVAINDTDHTIYLSSGAIFSLAEKECKELFNRMCVAGKILGLGTAAAHNL